MLIGAGATVLGNITIGKGAQVLGSSLLSFRVPMCLVHSTASAAQPLMSTLRQRLRYRKRAVQVAAGSLVLRDVPPKIMVAGSPARPVGKVSGEQAAMIWSYSHCTQQLYYSNQLHLGNHGLFKDMVSRRNDAVLQATPHCECSRRSGSRRACRRRQLAASVLPSRGCQHMRHSSSSSHSHQLPAPRVQLPCLAAALATAGPQLAHSRQIQIVWTAPLRRATLATWWTGCCLWPPSRVTAAALAAATNLALLTAAATATRATEHLLQCSRQGRLPVGAMESVAIAAAAVPM